jgi:hypothetical protein
MRSYLLVSVIALALSLSAQTVQAQPRRAQSAQIQSAPVQRYFDAHNHITGVLPYYAYANLPVFIDSLSNPQASVGVPDRLALYHYLADVWYAQQATALDDKLFSPADGQRFALGSRAALVVFHDQIAGSVVALNGVLERVLTATPWTEFDSAYAFRGGPVSTYLLKTFYNGDEDRLGADLCKATVLDLAATNIDDSEQSLPFIGGWRFSDGKSWPLSTVTCVMNAAADPSVRSALGTMHREMPSVKIVLMTHTAQLASMPDGKYIEWSKNGTCSQNTLPNALVTTPKMVYDGLMGWDHGKLVVESSRARQFYDTVVGIDTAGPETTCFTPGGMQHYQMLVDAVYRASKARRLAGWNGKLLVHTHVGEGAVVNYAPTAPAKPWTFQAAFSQLPATRSRSDQAESNLSMLLSAIAAFETSHPDVHDYVVFRLAHATWATAAQAQAMHDEQLEADVNLESNVATGAYPIARMPLGTPTLLQTIIGPLAQNPQRNFELNDLLDALIRDPNDSNNVGGILGNASLKYLLAARVRCLLGTDADGVEHSDIVKEYAYATALITYWNRVDPSFRERSGHADRQRLFDNVRWHIANMASDTAPAY